MSIQNLLVPNSYNLYSGTLNAGATTELLTEDVGILISSKKALLNPRLTTAQRNLLDPTNGMQIYNTTTNQIEVYQNGVWVSSSSSTILAGDVSGPANANTVNLVGGKSASTIAASVNATTAATNTNTPSTIVKRDASGNFSAGTITASLNGNASSSTTTTTATNCTVTNDTTTAAAMPIIFTDATGSSKGLNANTSMVYRPDTNSLSVIGGTLSSTTVNTTNGLFNVLKVGSSSGQYLNIVCPDDLTATRALNVSIGDVDRTLTLGSDVSLNQNLQTTSSPTFAALTLTAPLTEANGGTHQSTYATGDTLYSSASNTLAKLAGNTTATKMFLSQTGNGSISAAPSWLQPAASDLSNGTSGTGAITLTSAATAWSPVLSDGAGNNFTMSGQQAGYVKFGPLTWFWGHAAWTSLGSAVAGNNVNVTLPSATTPVFFIAFSVGYSSGMGSASQCMGVGSSAQFFKLGGTQILVSDCSASGEVYFSGMYY